MEGSDFMLFLVFFGMGQIVLGIYEVKYAQDVNLCILVYLENFTSIIVVRWGEIQGLQVWKPSWLLWDLGERLKTSSQLLCSL